MSRETGKRFTTGEIEITLETEGIGQGYFEKGIDGVSVFDQPLLHDQVNFLSGGSPIIQFNDFTSNLFSDTNSNEVKPYSDTLLEKIINPGGNPLSMGGYIHHISGLWLDSFHDADKFDPAFLQWMEDEFGFAPNITVFLDRLEFTPTQVDVLKHNDVIEVPEPSTFAVFALALVGLGCRRFKQQ